MLGFGIVAAAKEDSALALETPGRGHCNERWIRYQGMLPFEGVENFWHSPRVVGALIRLLSKLQVPTVEIFF